jgi:hypothetical protein
MLSQHSVCGANTKFTVPVFHQTSKKSHYLAKTEEPSRDTFTDTYLRCECKSQCFVDGTPDNFLVPLAAARLYSMMSSAEAVRARRKPCLHVSNTLLWLHYRTSLGLRTHSPRSAIAHTLPDVPLLLHRCGRSSLFSYESRSPDTFPSSKWKVESADPICPCRKPQRCTSKIRPSTHVPLGPNVWTPRSRQGRFRFGAATLPTWRRASLRSAYMLRPRRPASPPSSWHDATSCRWPATNH